jgi:hypothetical protein
MRHDKAIVAAEAVSAATIDTAVGDYERMILFTGYVQALELTDTTWLGPFTGSYIHDAPLAVTLVRLMLEVIDRSHHGDEASASELLVQGVRRITAAYDLALVPGNELPRIVASERNGWDRYYEAVASLTDLPGPRDTAAEIIGSTRLA